MLIIGGGKMGAAIAGGLVRAGREDISVLEVNEDTRNALRARLPQIHFVTQATHNEDVIVAVKPKDVNAALEVAQQCDAKRVLSIVAGITLDHLHVMCGKNTWVIRAMPNLGATVGMSATAMCAADETPLEAIQWAHDVLTAIGTVVQVTESQMDAVTGLSGSGPAYVFLVAEAMAQAGINAGLSPQVARQLVQATIAASAELLRSDDAVALRNAVATPGGTTAAGLEVLFQQNTPEAFHGAVAAAVARSEEIGRRS